MKRKGLDILLFILVPIILIYGGMKVGFFLSLQNVKFNPLFLQSQYETALEGKLTQLLEPAVGIGNVRTSVLAEITEQRMSQIQSKPPYLKGRRTVENGPLLVNQSVSVLINDSNTKKLPVYERLVKSAIGYTPGRGDMLTVEILPFVKVSPWTLGISPVLLARIAAVIFAFIIIGIFWLIKEWLSLQKKEIAPPVFPDSSLWKKVQDLPSAYLADLLKQKKPEISAFVLYHLSQEKAAQTVELLPANYMGQVILHLNHIEQLTRADKAELLKQTENELRAILASTNTQKKSVSRFEKFKNWHDSDLQDLLHYISKQDLIAALQDSSLAVQQTFARNIPPALWQSLIQQTQSNPCSTMDSQKAQDKIIQLAILLKGKI